jgi:hypothetical protein
MKNKITLLKTKILITFLLLFAPFLVSAQTCNTNCVNEGLNSVGTNAGFPQNGGGFLGANTVVGVIGVVIKLALFVSGALAVLFVVIGGVMYLTSAGNQEQADKGKKTITNALIGIIIIILSYVIVNVVVNLVNCGFNGAGSVLGGC